MNPVSIFYRWSQAIATGFSTLSKPQVGVLAALSYGITLGQSCVLGRVAEKLWWLGKADTEERRLQRWLANEQIDWKIGCQCLARWGFSNTRLSSSGGVVKASQTPGAPTA